MKLFGFSASPLVKFCPEEFNIAKGCNAVRIGTLSGFRAEEDAHLRDEGEGDFAFEVEFPEVTPVSNEWLSEFEVTGSNGNGYIGELILDRGRCKVDKLSLSGSSANCWIYCLSKSANGSAGQITETHEDSWQVSEEKLEPLVNYFATLLWSSIRVEDLPSHIREGYSLKDINEGLQLEPRVAPVEYADRVIRIKSEADFPVSEIRRIKSNIPFIKPTSFRSEQEVRMAFILTFRGSRVAVPDKAKILPLRPIDSIIG